MIPLGDDLPTRRFSYVNYSIIALTVATWVVLQGSGFNDRQLAATVCNLGMVPGELTHLAQIGTGVPIGGGMACVVDNDPINWLTPLISMFLHGSWGHIGGNMLFLWVFGDNVEDAMGHSRYLLFYLLCGLAAAAAHILSAPGSPVPTVGASGAISGIMGAYLVLYPKAHIRMFWLLFVVQVRAYLVLIYWFLLQIFEGFSQMGPMRPEVSGGVAVWAHVGGFVTGLLLIKLFENPKLLARPYVVR